MIKMVDNYGNITLFGIHKGMKEEKCFQKKKKCGVEDVSELFRLVVIAHIFPGPAILQPFQVTEMVDVLNCLKKAILIEIVLDF